MAGLLAARVLSDFYETVTVVERDPLPDGPFQRKGVPQGRHLHALLSRGSHALDHLFPGLLDEFVEAGAVVLNDGDLSRVYARVGPYVFNRTQKFSDPAAAVVCQASRPFLEFHVRRRVMALRNVRFLDNHDVVEPIAPTRERITGVLVIDHAADDTTGGIALEADLVVDAMGRSARTPAFLEALGYDRPAEQRSTGRATYSSQFVRIADGMIAEKQVIVRDQSSRGGLAAYEDGTWILTVGRPGIDADPPTDLAEMIGLAEQFAPPSIVAGLRSAQPLGDVAVHRYNGAVWRRYDKMSRFPMGFLVIGDALCSLNPIHGQGTTMAALEALALQEHLRDADATPQRFFCAAAKHIGPTWAMNQANDRAPSPVRGGRSLSRRLSTWVMNKAMKAAENDIVLTEAFVRIGNLIDSPTRLQQPSILARVVLGNLRHRRVNPPPAEHFSLQSGA
jgi:2-polyprenyl-6-methoxyphenol hydroxylase-like FAD-dependent oxidoreductase